MTSTAAVGTKNTTHTEMKPINEYIKESLDELVLQTDEFAQDLYDAVESSIEELSEEQLKAAIEANNTNSALNDDAFTDIVYSAIDKLKEEPYNYDSSVISGMKAFWYAVDLVSNQLEK